MALRRTFDRLNNRNATVGIFLIILLAIFAGPTLPRFFSDLIPFIDEGIPCEWVRPTDDRANHQSLLGRSAENPLRLRVQTTNLPSEPSGSLWVRIIVTNASLGTVPFVYDPQSVVVGDGQTAGLGLLFNPPTTLRSGNPLPASGSIPEQYIRVLGPRQTCVVTVAFAGSAVFNDPNLLSGTAQVRAYYSNPFNGQITIQPGAVATPIYGDQGLWTGRIESGPVTIPLGAS
ncbi:MAG: hypothetical protein HC828_13195 [Blastochloris sp.]|nr:hypothetical protein [Blastochloris sp.]